VDDPETTISRRPIRDSRDVPRQFVRPGEKHRCSGERLLKDAGNDGKPVYWGLTCTAAIRRRRQRTATRLVGGVTVQGRPRGLRWERLRRRQSLRSERLLPWCAWRARP